MKLRVELDGEEYLLEFRRNDNTESEYVLSGASTRHGEASVEASMPGVFSILLGRNSFTVAVARRASGLEVWAAGRRHFVALSDPRDRAGNRDKVHAAGPVDIRAQMPGKVIKVLVQPGAMVRAGEGVIIVEAMKMQNEMKSPKNGAVKKIHVVEDDTVAAGETLMVIE